MNPSHDPTLNPKDEAAKTRTPMHLLPPPALRTIAHVLKHGADRYGPYNWRDTSVAMTVYIAAALRHLTALMDGETMDPDSGLPHAAHVAAGMMIILDAGHNGTLIDDRNKTKEWRTESCMDDLSRELDKRGLYFQEEPSGNPHRGSELTEENILVEMPDDSIWFDGGNVPLDTSSEKAIRESYREAIRLARTADEAHRLVAQRESDVEAWRKGDII